MNYEYRERSYRDRARSRSRDPAPRADAITSALTAQVIICILFICCVMLIKNFDRPVYDGFKEQYSVMLSDSAQRDEAIKWFSDSEGLFGGAFNAIRDFVGGVFSSKPYAGAADEPEDEPEDEPSDAPGSEPSGKADAPPQAQESPAAADYDYLGKTGVAYLSATPVSDGLFQVNAKATGETTPAPAGSTLSPVYLAAKIKPPVVGFITSEFAYRDHPLTGKKDFHTGMDIAAEEGRDILAALPGKVVEMGESEIYGKYIVLQHSDNLKTSYSHCSEIIAQDGMAVRQGERIALVGQTGAVTGPHLHFSVIVDDQFTNPAWVLKNYIKLVN